MITNCMVQVLRGRLCLEIVAGCAKLAAGYLQCAGPDTAAFGGLEKALDAIKLSRQPVYLFMEEQGVFLAALQRCGRKCGAKVVASDFTCRNCDARLCSGLTLSTQQREALELCDTPQQLVQQ